MSQTSFQSNWSHLTSEQFYNVEFIFFAKQKALKQESYYVHLNVLTGILNFSKTRGQIQNPQQGFISKLLKTCRPDE
jgi:hypothetical protein